MSKKQPKLTPWFPGHVKPARPGVYERSGSWTGCFSYWTGKHWGLGFSDANLIMLPMIRSCEQRAKWRGLAVKP